MRITEIKLK